MMRIKNVTILFFVFLLILVSFAFAEKRAKLLSMKDLTDPSSPSYVPYPYPKNRGEIIADLEYAIKELFGTLKEGQKEVILGPPPKGNEIMLNLLEDKPVYKISEIIKVKNLSSGDWAEYSWLIIIRDREGALVARIGINDTGLYCCTLSYSDNRKPVAFRTEDYIIKTVSAKLGREINKKDVKRIEAMALIPSLGTKLVPARKVTLANGSVYYYSVKKDRVFRIKKKIPWKKNERGHRPSTWNYTYLRDYAFDQLNDEVIVFEEIKK